MTATQYHVIDDHNQSHSHSQVGLGDSSVCHRRSTARRDKFIGLRCCECDDTSTEEDSDVSIITTALLAATEEGNLSGIKELLDATPDYDLNTANKHGESVLHLAASGGHLHILQYLQDKGIKLDAADKHGDTAISWAARQGHYKVIQYIHEQGLPLCSQNKSGECALHIAARYSHTRVLDYLCDVEDLDLNIQDKLGETVLHSAAWHGLSTDIIVKLCDAGCSVNQPNKEEETALHCAAARGNLECVRILLQYGADVNMQDKRGCTPLHLSCRRHHRDIALLLLHAGAQFDVVDQLHDTPLHVSAKEGLLSVVQTLCAFGCQLDVVNKAGLTPLHQACRAGHIEVVRCLLLSGAEPDLPNKDGVTAEIMSLAQGHPEVAELLTRLKPERRESYMRQLMPTTSFISRIKLKVFGHPGVGKSTLVDSLKCGYFGSFFRKARLSTTSPVQYSPQKNGGGENGFQRQNSLPNQLSYEVTNDNYTKGIHVQQITVSGAGDFSVWEFSGYEPYYMLYDHFIGDPNCIHMIVYNIDDPKHLQLQQVVFWLDFLRTRIPAYEPIGEAGRHPWPARVVLVATHCDVNTSPDPVDQTELDLLLTMVKEKFASDFDISDKVFVVDAHLAMSNQLKALRSHLADIKQLIVQGLPTMNGFLESVVATLPVWRKSTASFPVLPWPNFIEFVRSKINNLTSEEHMKELVQHLQLMGEVIYLGTERENDYVILNPQWLCNEVIGQLLSHDKIAHSRPTGCYTSYDFQLMFPDCDATDLLHVLEALELCTQCDLDGDIEFEFPCLNFVETLQGLWEKDSRRYQGYVYGGVRLQFPHGVTNQLLYLFPRIQVHLRRNLIAQQALNHEGEDGDEEEVEPDSDIYQWHHGTKYCSGLLECLITLEQGDVIEVKLRGPSDCRTELFLLQEEVCEVIGQVLEDCCPGADLETHLLSVCHLQAHVPAVHSYAPRNVMQMQLEGKLSLQLDDDTTEEFIDLACFGSQDVFDSMTLGVNLHISHISMHARRQLAARLDPPDPMGRDWCLLAVKLDLTENVPRFDVSPTSPDEGVATDGTPGGDSKLDRAMQEWARYPTSTIAQLISRLEDLGRQDVVDAILNSAPMYRVFRDEDGSQKLTPAPSHNSDNTLSSVSR